MKNTILFIALVLSSFTFSQDKAKEIELPGLKNINNAIIIGQLDKVEDRYSIEINLTQLFSKYKIKTNTSLNLIKQGGNTGALASDTMQAQLKSKGFDTYILVSVRGYDKRFKKSTKVDDMKTEVESGHLFPLYREEIVSVTFEIIVYQNGVAVENRLIKVGSVGSRETVLRKFIKKMDKVIRKEWLLN